MFSDKKLIIAGNTIHYYSYNYKQEYGNTKKKKPKNQRTPDDSENRREPDASNSYRSKKAVKHIVEANAEQYANKRNGYYKPIFVTLTFRENVTELAEANPIFTKFVKRLNYFVNSSKKAELQYIVVPEFQKLTRQAVHYHAIFFNLPFIPKVYDEFNRVWGQGNVNVKTIYNTQHLSNYIVKYITKEAKDSRSFNKRSYFCSRGLNRPLEIRRQELVELLVSQLDLKPRFERSYIKDTLITNYQCSNITQEQKAILKSSLDLVQSWHLPDLQYYFPRKPIQQMLIMT